MFIEATRLQVQERVGCIVEAASAIIKLIFFLGRVRTVEPGMVERISRGGVEDTRLEAKAKDSLSEDRHSRGQGQECSRPRTKYTKRKCSRKNKKKKSSQKFFRRSPKKKKKGLHKNFSSDLHKKTFSKKFFNRSTKF